MTAGLGAVSRLYCDDIITTDIKPTDFVELTPGSQTVQAYYCGKDAADIGPTVCGAV